MGDHSSSPKKPTSIATPLKLPFVFIALQASSHKSYLYDEVPSQPL